MIRKKSTYNMVSYPKKALVEWLEAQFPETDWNEVADELPPIIWRSRWNDLAEKHGLPYTRKYVQNLDSWGTGPKSFCKKTVMQEEGA